MTTYYTAIIFISIFAMLAIQTCVKISNTLTKRKKRLFYMLFSTIALSAFCEWLGVYLQGTGSSTRVFHIIVKAVELSVAPSIGYFISWVIEMKSEKIVFIGLAVNAVIECLSGVFGFIYYVDENSNYVHAEFYWIYVAAYVISIIYCMYIMLRNVKRYQYNGVAYFLLVIALMFSGIVIQLYDSSVKVDYPTAAMASIMLYIFTLEMVQQTDELTELINRRGYENYICHLESDSVVIFFDVDKFKSINDNYGHAYGDKVLSIIGKTIKNQYARYGKCFRFGGDEFCAILTKNIDEVDRLNQNFIKAMENNRAKESRLPYVSIGYAHYIPGENDIESVVAEADQMMYKDKESHR